MTTHESGFFLELNKQVRPNAARPVSDGPATLDALHYHACPTVSLQQERFWKIGPWLP